MSNDTLVNLINQPVITLQTKTNIIHTFDVPMCYNSLEIFYSYSPKKVEDLEVCKRCIFEGIELYVPDVIPHGQTKTVKQRFIDTWQENVPLLNHMTLSIDENQHYIGAAHRHADIQEHTISEVFSSEGFIKTKIHSGTWRIILNVHAALTPMTYNLRVVGKGE